MDDDAFLAALEACTLPPVEFGHVGHVRAAYLCLRGGDFDTGLQRFRTALIRYATHLGAPGKYDEALTIAWCTLIHAHLTRHGDGGGWPGFAEQNPELLAKDRVRS